MTTTEEQDKALARLRDPFPPECVGKKPVNVAKDPNAAKSKCGECGGWLPRHQHLDFIGHAHVTDRLLEVDPRWDWEPVATDEHGLPLIQGGRMWIRLTVAGMTRIGVGSVEHGAFDIEKQLISDAIRNAAMRFGVGLSLWAKSDLESTLPTAPDPAAAKGAGPAKKSTGGNTPDRFHKVGAAKGLSEEERRAILSAATQGRTTSAGECTPGELAAAFVALAGTPDKPKSDPVFDLAQRVADISARGKALPPETQAEYGAFAKESGIPTAKATKGWTPELCDLAESMLLTLEESTTKVAS